MRTCWSTIERLEEDGFDLVCGVLLILLDTILDRADDWTNAKPCVEGANRQRSAATVDFIIVQRWWF